MWYLKGETMNDYSNLDTVIEIAKKYPTKYVEIVEQDASNWTGRILKKSIKDK